MSALIAVCAVLGSVALVVTGLREISSGARLAGLRIGISGADSAVTAAHGREVGETKIISTLAGADLQVILVSWAVALAGFHAPLSVAALVAIAVAVPLRAVTSHPIRAAAQIAWGISLAMLGVDLMAGRILPVPAAESIRRLTLALDQFRLMAVGGFVLGAVVSALFRSLTGTIVFATALIVRGWVPFDAAAAVAIGGSLGGSILALRAASPLGTRAQRSAAIHLGLSALVGILGGVILATPAVNWVSVPPTASSAAIAAGLMVYLTVVHGTSVLLLSLVKRRMLTGVRRLYPDSDETAAAGGPASRLAARSPESLDGALSQIQLLLARMAVSANEMLMVVINTTQLADHVDSDADRVASLRDALQDLAEDAQTALVRCVQLPCTPAQARRIDQLQRIARELSLVAEDCWKAMRLLRRAYRKRYRFHKESQDELFELTSQILDFLTYNGDYLEGKIGVPDRDIALRMEETIDSVRDRLRKRSRKALETQDDADVRGELAFIDIVRHLEHVGDRCLGICEAVVSCAGSDQPVSGS